MSVVWGAGLWPALCVFRASSAWRRVLQTCRLLPNSVSQFAPVRGDLEMLQACPSKSPHPVWRWLYYAVLGPVHSSPPFSPLLLNLSHQHLSWLNRGPAGTQQAGTEAQCGQIQLCGSKGRLNAATISMHSFCPSPRHPAPPPPAGARNQLAVLFTTYASMTPCKSMPGSL